MLSGDVARETVGSSEVNTRRWPHTQDPYKAAWAYVFRYATPGSMRTTDGEDLLDAIADELGLEDVPPWTQNDPVHERFV